MNVKLWIAALICGAVLTAHADTHWMVLPRHSSTGRTLLHGCRNTGTPVPLAMRWEKPADGGRFGFLSVGNQSGLRFAGINERGLAVFFTGAGPMVDPRPPKSPDNFNGHRGTVRLLGRCADAREAVAMLRGAAEKKLIDGALIFFIADRNHAWVVECSPGNFASWELTHPFCVYANYWKLPGMDGSAASPATRMIPCCSREWAARDILRRRFEAAGTISRADSFAVSRTNLAEVNGEALAVTRGKRKLVDAPHNRHAFDSYLIEIDPEFGELSCVYAACGPARHTVYLPVPLGAADALPPEIFGAERLDGAFARMKAAKGSDPVAPAILEFEAKLLAEFDKAREAARQRLYEDDAAGAREILRACLQKQTRATAEFLRTLK